ncbi:MAG: DUF3387 domain-containing protein [Schwartzia sp.]|nr:DUF3387 domain-containing protein [Schwartzia sp. (in: firmicutes)]
MSTAYTEADYENSIIELFVGMGYTHVYGPDVERDSRSPLYDEVLEESLRRLNPNLPADAIDDALFKLRNFENGELAQRNEVFMDYLQNGVPVSFTVKGEQRSAICYLVDYENPDANSFIVANQWTIVENSTKRPDVILFLNGLPVVLMELKSPSREETDASEAFLQLRNYMQEIPSAFVYNAICVMSDMMTSKAGTITSGEDRFMEWKTKDGSYENTQHAQFDTFFEGMFARARSYLNGMLTNEQVIEELLKLAKQISEAQKEGEQLGLTADELAFYDALTKPDAIKDFYENEELIAITKELADTLRKNRTIDWQERSSARAKMRMLIKKLLKKHRYPPEGMEDAVQTVMAQCELWTDNQEMGLRYGEYDEQELLMAAEARATYGKNK